MLLAAEQSGDSGFDDFVAKLTSDGALTWDTFLGGNGTDSGSGIAVDSSVNVYVEGYSDTTWGSPVRAYTARQDFYAAKLTMDGALICNTFLGGSGDDSGTEWMAVATCRWRGPAMPPGAVPCALTRLELMPSSPI